MSGTCSDYWSASEDSEYTDSAWFVYFHSGHVTSDDEYDDHYVRCVRSGP
ncbi:MAG: DUF1566 domain-containing protein [Chloroflexi bacterium]|nr:DUF1566 domain-containing protein [Chloroflexota bacterium]